MHPQRPEIGLQAREWAAGDGMTLNSKPPTKSPASYTKIVCGFKPQAVARRCFRYAVVCGKPRFKGVRQFKPAYWR